MESIFLGLVKGGLYKRVVFIYRWSLEVIDSCEQPGLHGSLATNLPFKLGSQLLQSFLSYELVSQSEFAVVFRSFQLLPGRLYVLDQAAFLRGEDTPSLGLQTGLDVEEVSLEVSFLYQPVIGTPRQLNDLMPGTVVTM